jgi:hypothetical protein
MRLESFSHCRRRCARRHEPGARPHPLTTDRIRQIDLFTSNLTAQSKVPTNLPAPEMFYTTYARLDPKFLREGEAKKVADEFEKKSGMSRETFLKKMAIASESSLSADDPNLTQKVMGKFSHFVDAIPNEEFRNKIQTEIDATNPKSRKEMILTGAKHAFEWLASKGINLGHSVAATAMPIPESGTSDRAPASAAVVAPVDESAPRPENPLSSAKKDFSRYMAPTDSGFRGVDSEKFGAEGIGGVLQAAVDQEKETIFSRVSRRYQALTPSMIHWDVNGR